MDIGTNTSGLVLVLGLDIGTNTSGLVLVLGVVLGTCWPQTSKPIEDDCS